MSTILDTVTFGSKKELFPPAPLPSAGAPSPRRRVLTLGSLAHKSPPNSNLSLALVPLIVAMVTVIGLSFGMTGASLAQVHILDSCAQHGTFAIEQHRFSCAALKGGAK